LTANDAKLGDVLKLPACQLEHWGELHAAIVKKTEFNGQPALQIDPTLVEANPNKKSRGSLHILASADGNYTPLEIRLTAFFGSFSATLDDILPAEAPSRAPADLPLFGPLQEPDYQPPVHAN